jgi:hypothetical protein
LILCFAVQPVGGMLGAGATELAGGGTPFFVEISAAGYA